MLWYPQSLNAMSECQDPSVCNSKAILVRQTIASDTLVTITAEQTCALQPLPHQLIVHQLPSSCIYSYMKAAFSLAWGRKKLLGGWEHVLSTVDFSPEEEKREAERLLNGATLNNSHLSASKFHTMEQNLLWVTREQCRTKMVFASASDTRKLSACTVT